MLLNVSSFLGSLPGELDPSQGSIDGINNQESGFKKIVAQDFFERAPFAISRLTPSSQFQCLGLLGGAASRRDFFCRGPLT